MAYSAGRDGPLPPVAVAVVVPSTAHGGVIYHG